MKKLNGSLDRAEVPVDRRCVVYTYSFLYGEKEKSVLDLARKACSEQFVPLREGRRAQQCRDEVLFLGSLAVTPASSADLSTLA